MVQQYAARTRKQKRGTIVLSLRQLRPEDAKVDLFHLLESIEPSTRHPISVDLERDRPVLTQRGIDFGSELTYVRSFRVPRIRSPRQAGSTRLRAVKSDDRKPELLAVERLIRCFKGAPIGPMGSSARSPSKGSDSTSGSVDVPTWSP